METEIKSEDIFYAIRMGDCFLSMKQNGMTETDCRNVELSERFATVDDAMDFVRSRENEFDIPMKVVMVKIKKTKLIEIIEG